MTAAQMNHIEPARPVLPYDFRQRALLSRAQLGRLRELHQSAAEAMTRRMRRLTRASWDVSLVSVDMVPVRKVVDGPDACYLSFTVQPAGCEALVSMDSASALVWVRRLLGSPSEMVGQGAKLSGAELSVARQALCWVVLGGVAEVWPARAGLSIVPGTVSQHPSAFADDWEIAGRLTWDVKGLADGGRVELWMGLEVLAQVAGPDETDADATKEESCRKPPANKNILNAAQGLTVEVSVELGSTELSVGEVLSLKVGDVVRLDSTVNDVLSARVQGRVAFKGRPGLRNGRLAFQVCQLGEQLEE